MGNENNIFYFSPKNKRLHYLSRQLVAEFALCANLGHLRKSVQSYALHLLKQDLNLLNLFLISNNLKLVTDAERNIKKKRFNLLIKFSITLQNYLQSH